MNPISADPIAPPQPPPPQPPRSSFSCDRHPSEQFTGFCPSCLCERLTSLDNSSSNTPSSSRRPSSASATAAAIKSLFSSNFKTNYFPPPAPKTVKPSSFVPQLRRTKSFSASKNETLGLSFEPQRKSCDVRVKNTLWSLFTLHDDTKTNTSATSNIPVTFSVSQETENVKNSDHGGEGRDDEIVPVEEEPNLDNPITAVEIDAESADSEVVNAERVKPMKDHINLHNSKAKKSSGGGLRAAASVFTKKWQKWREKQKQKTKKPNAFVTLPVEKPISRQYRETQSEIADYGFGRRSCDTDPRFSLDAGRISVDDPRFSFEEPRASWDGHLLGRSFSRMGAAAPMVSVLEDLPETKPPRPDMVIPVEEPAAQPEFIPGGSAQTREYYSESSSRRRKSVDRSSFIKKTAAAVVAEIDEQRTVSNIADYSSKVIVGDRNSNSNSLREEFPDTFELRNGFRNSSSSFSKNSFEKKDTRKSRRWSWRIWGFIHRRSGVNEDEEEEEEKCSSRVERTYSESLERTWEAAKMNRNITRSNSSVSWRNIQVGGSGRKSTGFAEDISGIGIGIGYGRKKRHEQYSYSPNNIADNGMLRFYLAPQMMNSTRRGGGMAKTRQNGSHSIARSVLRLY